MDEVKPDEAPAPKKPKAKRKPAAKSKKKAKKKTKSKAKRKTAKPKASGAVRTERLEVRLTKPEKAIIRAKAKKTSRSMVGVILDAVKKIK